MDRKQIQKKRIENYFIDAACQIIEQEGVNGVTVRKVAEIAGYHYATIYNYFQDLPHLILQAAFQFHHRYYEYIQKSIKSDASPWEYYRNSCEAFIRFSMNNPNIFRCVFMDSYGEIALDEVLGAMRTSPLLASRSEAIGRLVATGEIEPEEAEGFDNAVTSLCVGNILLSITLRWQISTEKLVTDTVQTIERLRRGGK